MRKQPCRAFTLIELLVVIAIIAVLISILIPSLQKAREQGKRAVCLANMKQIVTAFASYANEDSREHAFPVQRAFAPPADGSVGPSMSRNEFLFLSWWTWGGADGREPAIVSTSSSIWCAELTPEGLPVPNLATASRYAARYRPLNTYIYDSIGDNDRYNMPLFECPSDSGYPFNPDIDDMDDAAKRQRLYDSRGNSYRGSFNSFARQPIQFAFTMSPAGHRLSSVPNAADTVAFGEPLFFNMIGMNGNAADVQNPINLIGWHKSLNSDNVAYLDGSARTVFAERMVAPEPATATRLNVANVNLLARGPNYRLDVYPTGGAALVKVSSRIPSNTILNLVADTALNQWPKQGFQDLLTE